MAGWLLIGLVHIGQEVSLLHFLVELILAIDKSRGLLDVVPLLGSLTVSVGPPLGHRVWLVDLGVDSHWMTCGFLVRLVHIWQEITLLHFLVEFLLTIYESGSFLNVVPFLRSLSVAMGPPLSHIIRLIRLTYLRGNAHWVRCWFTVLMVPGRELLGWLPCLVIKLVIFAWVPLMTVDMPPIIHFLGSIAISISPLIV